MRSPRPPRLALYGCTALLLLAGWYFRVSAQPQPQYQFDHWGTDAGLPQSAANAVCQTRDGYLWVATSDGLARFDGTRFTVFNKINTPSLPGNRFSSLYEDDNGVLWAVTEGGWLVKREAGVFTTYTQRDGLPAWSGVIGLGQDAEGRFQATSREGVATWHGDHFVPQKVAELMPAPPSAQWVEISNVLAKLDSQGLYLYAHGSFTVYQPPFLPSLRVDAVFEERNGTLWLATQDKGLVRLAQGRATAYPAAGVSQWKKDFSVLEDHADSIWFTGFGPWLGHLQQDHLTQHTEKVWGYNSVTGFCQDREGNLWIGTTHGLHRARLPAFSVITPQSGLLSDNLYTIYQDRDKAMWFGFWGDERNGGVTRFHNGAYTHYRIADGLASGFVTALYEESDGALLIATTGVIEYGGGIRRIKQGRVSVFPDPQHYFGKGVWAIYQDSAGRRWFGTPEGLVCQDTAGKYTRYLTEQGLPDSDKRPQGPAGNDVKVKGLAGNDVSAILEDRNGVLWIGTRTGLSSFQEGCFTSYTGCEGLGSTVRALYEDAQGVLWIGTYDSGLSRWQDGKLTTYTEREGLYNNGVFRILEDERGYFWISCNRGIYAVQRQQLEDFAASKLKSVATTAYGQADGLPDLECNGGRQPAGWKTRDGRLWFPSNKGAVVIDPSRLETVSAPPAVLVEEARLNRETAAISNATLEIPPEKNSNLEIRYQSLSFIRPEQMRFKYRLDGIDEEWVEVGNRRVAYYNELPPGDYAFRMLTANSDGVWSLEEAQLRVIVHPAWWQTWWFRVGAVLSVALLTLGLVVLFYQRRLTHLKREQELKDLHTRQLRDLQERDRHSIAQDLHDELAQFMDAITSQAKNGLARTDQPDESGRYFTGIQLSVKDAKQELRRIAYRLHPPELARLGLTRALQMLLERCQESAPATAFAGDIEPIDDALDAGAQAHLYHIAQAGLHNVMKHSQARSACLTIKCDGQALRLTLCDDGRGFVTNGLAHNGLGLGGIHERARLLGGTAEILSTPGQGTTIDITIPRIT